MVEVIGSSPTAPTNNRKTQCVCAMGFSVIGGDVAGEIAACLQADERQFAEGSRMRIGAEWRER